MSELQDQNVQNKVAQTCVIEAKPHYPTLNLDVTLYQEIMDDPSIPQDKKHELLESLWAIAVACVDLGLGLHPLQQACGQFELYDQIPTMLSKDVVDCKYAIKDKFEAVNPADAVDSRASQSIKEEETHEPGI